MSDSAKKRPSNQLGLKRSEAVKKIISEKVSKTLVGNKRRLGTKDSAETIAKKVRYGEKNNLWKGGIDSIPGRRSWISNKRNRVVKRLKKIGKSHTFGDWETLKAQYNFTCPCCKKSEPEIKLTEDHIIPLSKGGSDEIVNIQPLCLPCNIRKHTRIVKYLEE